MAFIFAVAKNGLWDDPVESTTGGVYQVFVDEVATKGLGKQLAPYLTWRYCYLLCGVFWTACNLILSIPEFLAPEGVDPLLEEYQEQLPENVQEKHFLPFSNAWLEKDRLRLIVRTLSFFVLIVGVVLARPGVVLNRLRLSRHIVIASWFLGFLVPFVFLLVYPIRRLVDWVGVEGDICVEAAVQTYITQPVNLTSSVIALDKQFLPGSVRTMPLCNINFGESCVEDYRTWCLANYESWNQLFFGGAIACAFTRDEECEINVCSQLRSATERLRCIRNCLEYSKEQAASEGPGDLSFEFWKNMTKCETSSQQVIRQFVSKEIPAPDGVPQDTIQLFKVQRQLYWNNYRSSRDAGYQLQLLVGTFVATWTGQTLIPQALSLLTGVAEAFLNTKITFTAAMHPSFNMATNLLLPLPIYIGLGACLEQVIGDYTLACLLICAIMWLALPAITAIAVSEHEGGEDERWRLYRRVWVEYGQRVVLAIVMIALIVLFGLSNGYRAVYFRVEPIDVVKLVLLFLGNKALLAVVVTDTLLLLYVRAEVWGSRLPEDSKAMLRQTTEDLAGLLCPQDLGVAYPVFREESMVQGSMSANLKVGMTESEMRDGVRVSEDGTSVLEMRGGVRISQAPAS